MALDVINTIAQVSLAGAALWAVWSWKQQLRGTTDFNVANEALICATAVKLAWATASRDSRKPGSFPSMDAFWKWVDIEKKPIGERTEEERMYCAQLLGAMFHARYQPIRELLPDLQRHAAIVVARWPESESLMKEFLWSVRYFEIVSEGLLHYEVHGHSRSEKQTHEFAFRECVEPSYEKLAALLRTHL